MEATQISATILIVLLLQGCVSGKSGKSDSGKSGMDNIVRILKQDNPDEYETVMKSFIKSAKSGDVEKMVSLTSSVTLEQEGVENQRQIYEKDTAPFLKGCTEISEEGVNVHVDKQQSGTGPGWIFGRVCTYGEGETVKLKFVVLKEKGRIALTSFGFWPNQQLGAPVPRPPSRY